MSQLTQRTRRRNYPHGTAIDPSQLMDHDDAAMPKTSLSLTSKNDQGSIQISELFVTMCFFARLGFVQPPSCLKCAYRSARCSSANSGVSIQNKCKNNSAEEEGKGGRSDDGGGECNTETKGASTDSTLSTPKPCRELIAWRVDANLALSPDNLEGNIVFITCDTAKSLVNGDTYPSIRWDVMNKRLLFERNYSGVS